MSSGSDWVLVKAGLGLAVAAFVLSWLFCAVDAGTHCGSDFWTGRAGTRATRRPCLWVGVWPSGWRR